MENRINEHNTYFKNLTSVLGDFICDLEKVYVGKKYVLGDEVITILTMFMRNGSLYVEYEYEQFPNRTMLFTRLSKLETVNES